MAAAAGKAKPYFNASAVAALIGEHPHKPADAALLAALSYDKAWRPVIAALKAEASLKTADEVLADATAAVPALSAAIETGVAAAVAAEAEAAVTSAIAEAVSTARAAIAASAAVATSTAVETSDSGGAALSAERTAAVAEAVAAQVRMQRGAVLEAATLDAHEAEARVVVSARNTVMLYLRTPDYALGGRIDGFDAEANTVVEAKTRARKWGAPPAYDLVQLRVYLAVLAGQRGAKPGLRGRLLERFPDGTSRTTEIEHDAAEWARIHEALLRVVARFRAVTTDDVRALVHAHCI